MSLADFSFTQLFCALDEATAEPKQPSPGAALPPSATNSSVAPTMSSSGVPITVKPVANPATLSTHDCVLLKLSLTCALCGRLLRHQPAAIQTCGHCFCYKCINSALENGCVPLVAEWPWCTLAEEVSAAGMRWTVASGDISASAQPYHPAAKDSSGVVMQATGKTADDQRHFVEAPEVTSPAARAVRTSTVPPTRQSRKPRKLCQVCPLCLLPAFKWMLVPLPPLADLCTALHAAYPQMEETLMHLTADVLDSAAPIAELQPAPPIYEKAEGQVDSDGKRSVRCASALPSLITTAFACRLLPSAANAQQCDQGSQGERCGEEDEEKGSRSRRKKGARKEITFAADIASRVSTVSTPATTSSHAPVNQTNEPVVNGPCPTHKIGVRDIEAHLSNPAEAGEQDGNLLKAALFASPQFSVDLIPSPALTPTGASVPRHNFSPSTWPPGAEINVLLSTSVCRDDLLGNSPAEASDYKTAQQGESGDANDMTMLHTSPTHRHKNAVEDTAVVVAEGDGLNSSPPLLDSQQHRLFLPNNVLSLPSQGSVLSPMPAHPRCGDETDGLALSSTSRPVLLDSTDASWLAHASSIPRRFLWDGVHKGEGLNMTNRDQGCPATSTPRSRVSYSTIRVSEITQEVFSKGNEKTDESDTDHEHPHRVATSALPTIRPRMVETTLASVHTEDIWELDTALARRHPRLPACFAALRHGRVRWEENGASGTYKSELAVSSKRSNAHHLSPPVLCVAGHYPQGPCLWPDSRSSNPPLLPTLTPAACTSLLIGVPCLDMKWFMSPISSPWTAHAVSGWRKNTTFGNKTPLLVEEEERQEPNAFQDTLNKLAAAPHTFSHTPQLATPPLASWMATTQRALLNHLHPSTHKRSAEIDADPSTRLDCAETYLFFLLPDGATRQLAQMLYHQWVRNESCGSQNAESTSFSLPTFHQIQSCKRSRSEENDEGVAHDGGDWSVTDGHPQRAWRRLLLVAGGAVVELSWTLFKSLVATSTALEVGERATDPDALVNALASHIRHQHAGVDGDLWAHVDVAEPWNEPSPLSQSATRSPSTPVAQHTFIVLYSTALARDVFEKLVNTTNARGQSTHISPSSPATFVSLPSEEHGAAAICACLLRFKAFLDRLSLLIAIAASPVLPGGDSYSESAQYRHEARPSSWLLENIAEGRCSMTNASQSETPNTEELTRPRRDADSFSQGRDAAESISPFEEAAPTPLYRVGAYRSLLYADTP